MTSPYNKPALTIEQQIAHLRAKGMVIDDEEHAKRCLLHISYYRLSAYWLPFEYPKNQQTNGKCLKPDTAFETIYALHEFDRILRRLVMDAIEEIEISIRGNWAYQMAMLGDGHAYLSPDHYGNNCKFEENKQRLTDEVKRSKETFIKHYKRNYTPALPPIWMVAEILSFGSLSHWYANLKEKSVRQSIADPFGVDETIFKTFIHHLSVVRNTCAHHSRLWNKIIHVPLKLPKRPQKLSNSVSRSNPQKIYNTLTMLCYFLAHVAPESDWQDRLVSHLETLPFGDLSQLGFPEYWQDRPVWKGGAA